MSALAENSSSGSARHCRWEMSGAFCSSVSLLALSSSPMRLRSRWCHSCWSMSSICWTCLPRCSFINIFSPTQFNESGTTFIWWIIDMKKQLESVIWTKGKSSNSRPKVIIRLHIGGWFYTSANKRHSPCCIRPLLQNCINYPSFPDILKISF